jgi:hypothetical protein
MESKTYFDWSEKTPDVGNVDDLVRLIEQEIGGKGRMAQRKAWKQGPA